MSREPLGQLWQSSLVMIKETADGLLNHVRRTYRCFHTAAMLLPEKNGFAPLALTGTSAELPDLLSPLLSFSTVGDTDARLSALAERQGELSGMAVNWLGTYGHPVRFLPRNPTPTA